MSTHFLIHDRLAAGGMGVVHAGTMVSQAGRRRVAIKRLSAHGEMDAGARARLVAEARLVFRLNHRNICQVLDLGAGDDGAFIVMELVDGLDLRTLLKQLVAEGQRLDVASAVYVAREVAQALDYAHRRTDEAGQPIGLVHGDVTPANILLSVEGEVKLTDFGIARALGTTAPGTHLVGGTPGYVPPEAEMGAIDCRADVYSLGVTLHAALTGKDPSRGFSAGHLARERPEVSPQLVEAVVRMTAARAGDRYLSAGEVERVLALELARRYPAFTPSALAQVVRARAAGSPAVVEAPLGTLTSLTTRIESPRAEEALTAPDPVSVPSGPVVTRTAGAARPRRIWPVLVIGALGLLLGGAAVAWRLWQREPSVAAAPTPTPTPTPIPSTIPSTIPSPIPSPIPIPSPSPSTSTRPHRPTAPRAPAHVTVNSVPWGAVYIDGKKVSDDTPLYRHALAPGRHEVKVFYPDRGRYSATRRIDVASGEDKTLGFHP